MKDIYSREKKHTKIKNNNKKEKGSTTVSVLAKTTHADAHKKTFGKASLLK